jgi:phosphate-selective porin
MGNACLAQNKTDSTTARSAADKRWYENISLRGYVQARYNRLLETNPKLKNEQGDRSWGENGGFFLRRIRMIFFGQISKQVYFYIQPDFASSSGTTQHIGQIRDAYIDLGIDPKNEYRLRIGQSKVPYGFENMQSSQNRLPLDRNDALNSAVFNERDLGVFFYWAPERTRKLFSSLVSDGLKGSGDYGVFAFGLYNGQTANRPEQNNNLYTVARISYPFTIGNQIIEPGLQAYTGEYVLGTDQLSHGVKYAPGRKYTDQRVAGSFVLYPKPFGIQAEYNFGRGPEYNPGTDSIETRALKGGYITVSYLLKAKKHTLIPFTRYQYYEGGKKHELDARSHTVREWEAGIEWQPVKQFELVAMYTLSSRRFEDHILQANHQKGRLLRLQVQINF